ncbi:MAG: ferritin family protein [bacterium]|nr:ferritin family protein [bacterium]
MIQPTKEVLDALHFALKLELDSAAFYQETAKKATNPLGKATFKSLIKEELGHIDMVKKAYVTFTEAKNWKEVKKLLPKKYDKTKQTIFQIKKAELTRKLDLNSDDLQALQTAMEIEREGYTFYAKAEQDTLDPIGKKFYAFLKEEENRHWELLENTYEYLKDPALWFAKEEKHSYDGG